MSEPQPAAPVQPPRDSAVQRLFEAVDVGSNPSLEAIGGLFAPLDRLRKEDIPLKFAIFYPANQGEVTLGGVQSLKKFVLEECPDKTLDTISLSLRDQDQNAVFAMIESLLFEVVSKSYANFQGKSGKQAVANSNKMLLSKRALLEYFILRAPAKSQKALNKLIDKLYVDQDFFSSASEKDLGTLNELLRIVVQGGYRKTSMRLVNLILKSNYNKDMEVHMEAALTILGHFIGKEMPTDIRESMILFNLLLNTFTNKQALSMHGPLINAFADAFSNSSKPFWTLRFQIATLLQRLPSSREKLRKLKGKHVEHNLLYVLISNEKLFLCFLLFNEGKVAYSSGFRNALLRTYPNYSDVICKNVATRDEESLTTFLIHFIDVLVFIVMLIHIYTGFTAMQIHNNSEH